MTNAWHALLLPVLTASASAASAQVASSVVPEIATPSGDVAVVQDAPAYADLISMTIEEATWRLRAQEASVAATDALRVEFADRLAGIAIEQTPDFRIVMLLTGDQAVAPRLLLAAGRTVPIEFHTGAAATIDDLNAAIRLHQADLRAALAHPPGMGVDQRSGRLVIVVAASDFDREGRDALTARLSTIAGVPVHVRSIDRPEADLAAEGGMRLVGSTPGDPHRYLCTAGFAVTDGQRDALTTAAHCPDTLGYVDADGRSHDLPFVGQWGWGYRDVQINASDKPLAPLFYADAAKTVSRPVTGSRAAAGMRAGDVVCHRGERTGYSCGTVDLTSFAPAGDLCGGACTPSWTTVATSRCGGGDSGSPVFIGNTALGILKGGSYRADGRCSFYFYMSTDYLPPPWRLKVADASPTPASVDTAPINPSR